LFLKFTFLLGTYFNTIAIYKVLDGDTMAIFAKRFKYLREKNSLTQDKVAEKLGISRPTIAGYESHEKSRIPREETLNKIADLFDTTTDYLLGRTDDPSPNNKEGLAFFGGINVNELTNEEKEYLEKNMEKSLAEFRELRAKFLAKKGK
jgi:transcriptional regulator with XRE-family HTH domain